MLSSISDEHLFNWIERLRTCEPKIVLKFIDEAERRKLYPTPPEGRTLVQMITEFGARWHAGRDREFSGKSC